MGRRLGQSHRMNIGDDRLIENILHRPALLFGACQDVGVGIRHDVKLAGSE